jgi:dolichol-phosphate mannosyltransferase
MESGILAQSRPPRPRLDIVIPLYNEREIVAPLIESLRSVFSLKACETAGLGPVCFLFVDDGSTDDTAALLAREIERGLPAILCRLSRNFGHQNAVAAGLDRADADLVAIIDADLQDPPELILGMVERWREGADVVYGRRRRRRENAFKVAGYWLFYRLVAILADIQIPLDSGDFCLMDRRVVKALRFVPEKLRFVRGLRAWVGFKQEGIEYDRPSRRAGRSKYGIGRLYRLATDGVVSSSVRPLQLAQVFSVSYLLLTLALGLLLLLRPELLDVPPALLVVYLLIVSGNLVQVFCIYILGAYVGRTYLEAKGRPSYVVMELVGGSGPTSG